MNKEQFIKEVKKLDISLTNEMLNQLDIYYKMLVEYNIHTNLTRITEEKEVYLKHFYDSLTLVKAIKLDNQSLLDIGTGAGFPGLVLKIVFPNLKVTLLDALNKRIVFLNSVIEKLNLKGIVAIHARAEEFVTKSRESFDIVTSRAVSNLNMLSELCIPYLKTNGYFIPMKAEVTIELDESLDAFKTLGCVLRNKVCFCLPYTDISRTLLIIEKISETPKKFPRKFNEIKKKAL